MPKTETILQVFVASPSDVAEERRLLEEVIREINITWSDAYGIRFVLVQWETHSAPGFGDDAQDVINEQIPSSYDIFIGLMWTRFGTPTKRADSGTAEEFERAYARHKQDPDSVDIMFYFKNTPISPSDIDPDQLRDVLKFKSRLGDLGGLYGQFDSTDEFRNSVRVHLGRLVSRWAQRLKREGVPREPSSELTQKAPDGSKEEEEGFLDLIETAENSIGNVSNILTRMTQATEDLGEKTQERTTEFNKLQTSGGSPNIKTAKKVAANFARDLQDFAVRMNDEIPCFSGSFSTAMDSFGRAAVLTADFDNDNADDLQDALDNVIDFRSSMAESRDQVKDFRDVISNLPRMTTVFNRARRNVLTTLDVWLGELDKGIRQAIKVEALLSELIQSYNDVSPDG